MAFTTTFLDPDYRRWQPMRPENACCRCQKAVAEGREKWVRLLTDGVSVVAWRDYGLIPEADDMGFHRIGPDCARKLGRDFISPEAASCPH